MKLFDTLDKLGPALGPTKPLGIIFIMPIMIIVLMLGFSLMVLSMLPLAPFALIAMPCTLYHIIFKGATNIPEHWSTFLFLRLHKIIIKMWGVEQNNT